jgi:tight adherence protein B
MTIGFLATLVFLVASGGIVGIYMLVAGRSQAALQKTVEDRLQEASGLADEAEVGAKDSLIRTRNAGLLPGVDRVARAAIKGSRVERWLEQSGVRMSVGALCLVSLLLGMLGGLAAFALSHRPWVMPIGFVLGVCVTPAYLRRKRTVRLNKFEEQFPEALDLMSRAIRAGHAFSAGLKMVADEMSEPVGPEFRKAFDEQNYGLPLKESLNNLSGRIPLLDVRFFSTAVLIQRDTGGNLSEILDNLANVVRERFKIHRQVRVHTAHGRFTGYVLLGLPAFLAVALSYINPDHMKLLFEDKAGQMMVVASIVMQAIGYFWIKQVIKIEV